MAKYALITGCSQSGIGAALAQAFIDKRYHVFATVRDAAKLPQSLRDSDNVTMLTLDVLSAESLAAAVKSVKEHTGGELHILVNNSGGMLLSPLLDVKLEEGRKLFDLNVFAPVAVVQAFAPMLIKGKGCVVNNTSASAFAPFGFMSTVPGFPVGWRELINLGMYNASKAALVSASETMRHELQPLGVRTITLVTTGVKTGSFSKLTEPEVPETSYYYGVRELVKSLGDGSMQKGAISAADYASRVVKQVERGTAGIVWAGTDAQMARFSFWLLPQSGLVGIPGSP